MRRIERAARDRARTQIAMLMAAGAMGIEVESMQADSRSPRDVMARQVGMYIASVGFGMSYGRVGAALGRDRSTVQYACRLVEDRRDDPAFDKWIEALEVTASRAPVMP